MGEGQPVDDRSRTHVTKDLTHSGSFPLSAVTSARLPRVTTPPGSSADRGKTSCPQQLAQPRTTRDHQQGNGLALCLYDVTTLYFETEHEDDLRRVGYSKERRVDPQVIIGLLVDRHGFPLQVGCWEGNRAETTTIIPIVEAFQAAHGIEDLIIVAGRRHALSRQPDSPGRREAAVHRRRPHHPGPRRPGGPLPLARGRPRRRAGH